MLKMLKERVHNYGFWTALFSLIFIGCQVLGITVVPEKFRALTDAVLIFLTAAGVVSNPKDGKWFGDTTSTNESETKE